MRKTLIAAAVVSVFASSAAMAELSYNVGLASEYSYRGISQSDNGPALSGGVDYAHESGAYVGAWASTITWLEDFQAYTSSAVEVDLYGGYKFAVTPDVELDVGVLRYQYPGTRAVGVTSPNTTEVYVGASYKMVGLKYSRSTTDLFGFTDSDGSSYVELNAGFEIADGYELGLHVGKQSYGNDAALDYTDYKVGVSKDFGFLSASLAYVGTSGDQPDAVLATDLAPNGSKVEDLYKGRAVLSVSKSF